MVSSVCDFILNKSIDVSSRTDPALHRSCVVASRLIAERRVNRRIDMSSSDDGSTAQFSNLEQMREETEDYERSQGGEPTTPGSRRRSVYDEEEQNHDDFPPESPTVGIKKIKELGLKCASNISDAVFELIVNFITVPPVSISETSLVLMEAERLL